MDKDKLATFLYDILRSCQEIEEETDLRGKNFETFCNDRVYRRFVERNFEIIGEAMNRVLKLNPDIEITSARKIVDTRNLVIHSYDSIDKEILWSIIIKHLPLLKTEVNQLIESSQEFR